MRDRLRTGDVWVTGRRQYRSCDERLISGETLRELQQAGTLPIAVEADFEQFMVARQNLLDERLTAVDTRAKDGKLPDVTINKGVLKIAAIEKSPPPEAEALAAHLYAMRHCFIVGRSILPDRGLRPECRPPQCTLQPEARV